MYLTFVFALIFPETTYTSFNAFCCFPDKIYFTSFQFLLQLMFRSFIEHNVYRLDSTIIIVGIHTWITL